MSKLFQTIFIILIFFNSAYSKEIHSANVGYLTDGMDDIKYKDARIAFKMWLEDLSEQNSLNVDLMYYDSSAQIIKDFVNAKLNYLTINPIFYLQNQKAIDASAKGFWTVNKSVKQSESYLVLVRNDSQIKTLKDLKNKTVATREDNYLGKMFFDAELLKATQHESKGFIESYHDTAKFSTAILNTYFSKVDACVVPEYALELVSEMNPNIRNNLRVLKQSDEIFFSLMGIFQKTTHPEIVKRFGKNIDTLSQSVRGNNILDLFKMQGLSPINKEQLQPMKKYYAEYLQLRKLHVKK